MAPIQAAPPRAQAPSTLLVARSGGSSSNMRGVPRPLPSSLPDDGGVRGASGERLPPACQRADSDLCVCRVGLLLIWA